MSTTKWVLETAWRGGRSFDMAEGSSPGEALKNLRDRKGLKCTLKRAWPHEDGVVVGSGTTPTGLEPTPRLIRAVQDLRGLSLALEEIHKERPFQNEEEVTQVINTAWEKIGEDPDCDDLRVLWSWGWDWAERFLP